MCGYGTSRVVDYNRMLDKAFDTDESKYSRDDENEELKSSIKVRSDFEESVVAAAASYTT